MEPDGLNIDFLQKRIKKRCPAFLYTIPDFQNPSGITMSQAKRRALVELAAAYGLVIVEDIPFRELRYRDMAPPLITTIEGDATVITVGSVTKILSPGLRIGYAISDQATSLALAMLAENTIFHRRHSAKQ